ncbi:hypothetical protein K2173_016630 [Erythroxylum novogranatense]|uniref:Transcription factor CBF/NF-Y/archaeal histone domain-containing protein n=1 Tax=Erythroxylum novogranatense TaxID=1862640 RepID=A0AAV8SHE3_9ROSI|nr:hypothetical protein K2173_016630 [Erythroxylum novogranatense]
MASKSKEDEAKKKTKKAKEKGTKEIKRRPNSKKSPTKNTPTKPKQHNKNNNSNGTGNGKIVREPKVLVVPSSSCESQEVDEIGEEHEAKNPTAKSLKTQESKETKKKERDENEEEEEGTMSRFPMARIKRIIKSEDPSLQVGQDVVFLVNKATEKFLEKFCEEAYECSVRDNKKSLGYKHLSAVVSKGRRFDFLSDFVPEKLKAADALADREVVETGKG